MKIKRHFIGFSLSMIGLIGLLGVIVYWNSYQHRLSLKQLRISSVQLERIQQKPEGEPNKAILDHLRQLQQAEKGAERLNRFSQLISISILIVSFLLTVVFFHTVNQDLIHKLDQLSIGVKWISQGNLDECSLDYPLVGESSNEIDGLASTLEQLLRNFKQSIREKNGLLSLLQQSNKQLKQQQQEMKKYNRDLEAKLKEKAIAWEQANHELRLNEIKLKATKQEIKQLTRIDSLTGLYNRRELMKQLEREIEGAKRYQRPLSILMLDTDCFKHYNDIYGQREGDRLLAKIGKLVQIIIRKVDAGFRYGGDEFVLILPDTPQDKAIVLADRLKQEVERCTFNPSREDGKVDMVHTTISIGVAQYSLQDSINSVLKKADQAMWVVKRNGGSGIHIYGTSSAPRGMTIGVGARRHSA